jgi:plastocyanin
VPARIDPRNRTVARLMRGVAVLTFGCVALTACGGNGSDAGATSSTDSAAGSTAASSSAAAPSGSTQGQAITATEADFSISVDEDTLTAGSYTVEVVNNGNASHDLVIQQGDNDIAKSDSIGPGDTTTLTVDLQPGEYVFYCSIGNHRQMGMEKTVTVQ